MGQQEVLTMLKELRKINDDWHSLAYVKDEMVRRKFTNGAIKGLGSDLRQLCAFKQVDIKIHQIDSWNQIVVYMYRI